MCVFVGVFVSRSIDSTDVNRRRSAEELGTHAAMCFGTAGLDPALEGLSDAGLELLVSEMAGGAAGGEDGGTGVESATTPLLVPESLPLPHAEAESSAYAVGANGNGPAFAGAEVRGGGGAASGDSTHMVANGSHRNSESGNGDGQAREDLSQFDGDSVGGDPEVRVRFHSARVRFLGGTSWAVRDLARRIQAIL